MRSAQGHRPRNCRIILKDLIGVSAKVNVHDEGGVARSEGKAKRVIDKRKL